MKKVVLLFCSLVFLAGCASLTISQLTSGNRESLVKLYVGLPRANALDIMGRCPATLECAGVSGKGTQQIMIANPYRTEIVQSGDKKYEVLYYAIDINNDCTVNNDTLMPLVFENGKLTGWGKEFLQGIKK